LLLHPVDDQVADHHQGSLVRALAYGPGQSRGLQAMLLGQEPGLLQALRLVHQLKGFLHVPGLLEPPHDHRVQLRVLQHKSTVTNTNDFISVQDIT
jgi:NAD(P)H-dependent FMN reductase